MRSSSKLWQPAPKSIKKLESNGGVPTRNRRTLKTQTWRGFTRQRQQKPQISSPQFSSFPCSLLLNWCPSSLIGNVRSLLLLVHLFLSPPHCHLRRGEVNHIMLGLSWSSGGWCFIWPTLTNCNTQQWPRLTRLRFQQSVGHSAAWSQGHARSLRFNTSVKQMLAGVGIAVQGINLISLHPFLLLPSLSSYESNPTQISH